HGGPDVAYVDTTPGNAGGHLRTGDVDLAAQGPNPLVGWTAPGEWLGYTVRASQPQRVRVRARIAAPGASGRLGAHLAGGAHLPARDLPITGGWGSWQDVDLGSLYVNRAPQQLRLTIERGGFNLDRVQLLPDPLGLTRLPEDAALAPDAPHVYPSTPAGAPVSRAFRLRNHAGTTVAVGATLTGSSCFRLIVAPTDALGPNQATDLRVRLHCSAPGQYAGTLVVTTGRPGDAAITLRLEGNIVAP
ncbi:MAG: carbohydrate-binding domain-containing protein, partial [Acidobacteriota bacterium]